MMPMQTVKTIFENQFIFITVFHPFHSVDSPLNETVHLYRMFNLGSIDSESNNYTLN